MQQGQKYLPLSLSPYRPDGCVVPLGTPIDTGLTNTGGYTLNYNEFIVYDTNQVISISYYYYYYYYCCFY